MTRDDGVPCHPADCDPDCPGPAQPVEECEPFNFWAVAAVLTFLCIWGLLGWVGFFTVVGWLVR